MAIAVASVSLAACGADTEATSAEAPQVDDARIDAAALTDTYPCGHGFALGTPEQDVALLIYLQSGDFTADRAGDFARTVELPDPDWDAEVQLGERLFGNWCNDVAGPEELEPAVGETWRVTSGLLTIEDGTPPACDGKDFTATLADLEVTPPGGEPVHVGDLRLVNEGWGCFAG